MAIGRKLIVYTTQHNTTVHYAWVRIPCTIPSIPTIRAFCSAVLTYVRTSSLFSHGSIMIEHSICHTLNAQKQPTTLPSTNQHTCAYKKLQQTELKRPYSSFKTHSLHSPHIFHQLVRYADGTFNIHLPFHLFIFISIYTTVRKYCRASPTKYLRHSKIHFPQ